MTKFLCMCRALRTVRLPPPSSSSPSHSIRRNFATEVDGAGTSTGIEHALKFKQMGQENKRNFEREYKCIEYLHQNKYSYYDVECKLQEFRCPQPDNKKPDVEPKLKTGQ